MRQKEFLSIYLPSFECPVQFLPRVLQLVFPELVERIVGWFFFSFSREAKRKAKGNWFEFFFLESTKLMFILRNTELSVL